MKSFKAIVLSLKEEIIGFCQVFDLIKDKYLFLSKLNCFLLNILFTNSLCIWFRLFLIQAKE